MRWSRPRAYAADQLFATLDTTTRALYLDGDARPLGVACPTPSASSATCRTSWSRPSRPRCRRPPTPTCCCTWSTPPSPQLRRAERRSRARAGTRSAPHDVPQILVFNKLDAARSVAAAARRSDWIERDDGHARAARVRQRHARATASTAARLIAGAALAERLNAPQRPHVRAAATRPMPDNPTHRPQTIKTHDPAPPRPRPLRSAAWPPGAGWRRRLALTAAQRRRQPRSWSTAGRNDGPPDLDELWRDFNRKLGGLFGGKGGRAARRAARRRRRAVVPARHEERRHRRRPDRAAWWC